MIVDRPYDFGCWIIKYDRISINGKKYAKDALKSSDGAIVPLIWNHDHSSQDAVLGTALLENREDGMYGHFKLFKNARGRVIEQLISQRGCLASSPYITRVKISGDYITRGVISEVSLTPARVDPDDCYYPSVDAEVKTHV